jgi:rsbT co-antagonist protein RsbR
MLTEISVSYAESGFTPTETALSVFGVKSAVIERLETEGARAECIDDFLEFSLIVDGLGLRTFEVYAARREEVIRQQAEQVLELSTPVMKIWEGVLALPIVGTLDSNRTQVIMEQLLQMLVDTGATHAIIDITGVPTVDTMVAQHLLKTIAAARLMGAECIISGVRPQIAQTIVTLGIEFGDIVTRSTLAAALSLALQSVDHPSAGS